MKGTILLVEDDDILSRAYHDGFEEAGFTVETATDGAEAEAMMEKVKPDVIVLDLVIPIKTGFEVLEDIKSKREEYRSIPVVILSVLAEREDVTRAHTLGAVDYLIKSQFSMQEVIERVAHHVKAAQSLQK